MIIYKIVYLKKRGFIDNKIKTYENVRKKDE